MDREEQYGSQLEVRKCILSKLYCGIWEWEKEWKQVFYLLYFASSLTIKFPIAP